MKLMRTRRLVALLLCSTLLVSSACMGDDGSDDVTPTAAETRAADSATATSNDAGSTPTTRATSTRAATPTTAAPESTATRAPSATATAADASPTSDTGSHDPAVEADLAEIEADITEIRGLQLKEPIPSAIISRDELYQDLLGQLAEDYSQEEADQDTTILWLLRLIDDPDLDLYQLYVDLYGESVLGYYDPEDKRLVLVSDNSADGLTALTKKTMSHELVHTLQDQYYDIQALRPDDMPAEQAFAITALVEGDAELSSTFYVQEFMDAQEIMEMITEGAGMSSTVVSSAPAYISEGLYFPYQQGTEFVYALYQEGGYDRVDQAYADPPVSSEQILHPEKYLGERDDPAEVTLPDLTAALGSGWEQTRTDTIGEFEFQIMFRENGASSPDGAAAGWDGSTYALYENGDAALVLLGTTWDSEGDAQDCVSAYEQIFGSAFASGEVFDAGNGRFAALVHNGSDVTYISGTDRAAVEAALAVIGL